MSDQARSVLADPRAPASERFDAEAELSSTYRPSASDIESLMPSAAVREVINFIEGQYEEEAMAKAQRNNVVRFPGRNAPVPSKGMRSVHVDHLQIFAHGDYWEKPAPLGFDMLRTMVSETPVLSAVVMTRARQVSRFCQPSEDDGPGFAIKHRDLEHKLTPAELEATNLLSRFFQHCGWEFNPRQRKKLKRDSFKQFMAKLVRDSLTMDAAPIETEFKRDRALGIDGLYAVDGATIRLCTEDGYEGDDEIMALQVIEGRITTSYTHDQLIYEVRNPRSDVRLAGYGLGETELLVRTVTGFLNAMSYNIAGFDQNAIPKGLLHLTGNYGKEDLVAFRRMWNNMVRGVNNAWALPVMVSEDAESKASFEKFGVEFNEMHFAKWMTFLTSLICAIYGISPDEINFESFSAQKSSLSGSDTEEKLVNSKDSGLMPILTHFESILTDFVVADFDPNLVFRWTGLQDKDPQQQWEARKLVQTVDEQRAELGLEPHPDPMLGQAPLNPSLIGPWMQAQQAAQQPVEDYGDPDAGGDGGPPGAPAADGPDASGPEPPDDPQAGQGDGQAGPGFGGAPGGDFGGPPGMAKGFGTVWTIGG